MSDWTIPSGETATVPSGETTVSGGVNLAGELDLAGELNVGSDPYQGASSMTADVDAGFPNGAVIRDKPLTPTLGASVTVPTVPTRTATATLAAGARVPFTRSIMYWRGSLSAGASVDVGGQPVASSEFTASMDSSVSAVGTAFADTATMPASAGVDASVTGDAIRTGATLDMPAGVTVTGVPSFRYSAVLRASAGSDLEVTGVVVVPATRQDSGDLVYDDREEFELGVDG